MPFYGDPYPLQHWPRSGGVIIVPMSTGLVRIFSADCFIVAADGLQRKTDDDGTVTVTSDSSQKIFPIEENGRSLAYALTGTVGMGPGHEIQFDFLSKTAEAIHSMRLIKAKSLYVYATKICRSIHASLAAAKRSGRVERYPSCEVQIEGEPGETIAELFFDGYYNGRPASVRGRFFHENQKLSIPEIVSDGLADMRIYGSAVIARLLFSTEDPRFAKFRQPPYRTLMEAVKSAESYFLACADPEALRIDERCSGIGGHVHIATITPNDGFQWVDGFKPQT